MSDSESSALSSARSDLQAVPATTKITTKRKREESSDSVNKSSAKKRTRKESSSGSKANGIAQDIERKLVPAKASARGKRKPKVEVKEEVDIEVTPATTKSPKKAKKKTTKVEATTDANEAEVKVKVKIKRKTKEEKEAEAMPLAARTIGSKVFVGAHVSGAGGVHNAIVNSIHIGGNAFALFLKSQRKWENPPLQDEHKNSFLDGCKAHGYHGHDGVPPIVPHGSYLVNLAHPDPARTKQAYDAFLDDLTRCHKLGIKLYNFHPGNSSASESRSHAISHLASQLNKAHKEPSSGKVITLLETMTGGANVIGTTFEDLAETVDQVEDKERVGVCLDTCHIFAAGYDLREPGAFAATVEKFDEIVGLKFLRAFHINDSKAPFNSGRDLHANIGTGFLGLRAFHNIMNEPRFWGIPMILETPDQDQGVWAKEIKLLESLVGMDVEGDAFKKLEQDLWEKGTEERGRIQAQVDKKGDKAKEKEEKAQAKAVKAAEKEIKAQQKLTKTFTSKSKATLSEDTKKRSKKSAAPSASSSSADGDSE